MTDLDLIIKAINKTISPKKIILFGSRARGDNREDSDYDIAVIQKADPHIGQKSKIYRTLINMGYDWKVEPDIHLFSEDNFNERLKKNSLFIREIIKGKTIYEI